MKPGTIKSKNDGSIKKVHIADKYMLIETLEQGGELVS